MSRNDTVGKHATVIYSNGEYQCVKYHQTDVVMWNDKEIVFNSGGWTTNTTKLRMNQASNQFYLGFGVYQEKWEWYVTYKGETIAFEDGMRLTR